MIRRFFAVLIVVLVVGCGVDTFGRSTNYPYDYPDKIPVSMPANAPSIVHQFYTPQGSDARIQVAHEGFDVWARLRAPILAAAPGVVIDSFHEPLYGQRVHIDHGPGEDGRHVITRYFHLDERIVKKGDRVRRGQQIGYMGSTGVMGLAVHLHYEVRLKEGKRSVSTDPHLWWVGGPGKVVCFEKGKRYASTPIRMTYPLTCKT